MRSYAKKLMDTAILAGQIMLECNAESYRVEETIDYILSRRKKAETLKREAFAMATGIFATLDDDCIDSIVVVFQIELEPIYKVSNLSSSEDQRNRPRYSLSTITRFKRIRISTVAKRQVF